ncbi:MAG TPA: ABC transporter ATP-binding protein [Methanomassiliicoccales archaeon]|jgi:cobalt/nickel transport system ATP-binding protein
MESIRLEGVSYRYPESDNAIERLDIAIGKGERVALVGPNGAGKSTLLHIMAGLFIPTEGKASIGGVELTKRSAPEARKNVGLLFQDPDDQIFMPTVFEDVTFGPLNMGLPENEVVERTRNAMRQAGVEEYGNRVPHRLSTGEKKRVAIAGLLAMSPPTLLLDEPTANLDPQGKRDLVNVLDSLDQTIVLATHDLSVAFELTDRVIVLKRTILFDGDFRKLIKDKKMLAEARLELPSFSRLMESWAERTGRSFVPPLNVDEALEELLR